MKLAPPLSKAPTLFAGLLALVAGLAPTELPAAPPPQSLPALALRVCRVNVTPCQRELNLSVDGRVTLGLYLESGRETIPLELSPLVAWESHFRLDGPAGLEPVRVGRSAGPVQEQGDPALLLDSFTRLTPGVNRWPDSGGLYFRVQNAYDRDTGRLDYSIVLLNFSVVGQPVPPTRFPPGAPLLGMITLQGAGAGNFRLAADDSGGSASAFRIVVAGPAAAPRSGDGAEPLPVALNVGPAAEKARLHGRVWGQEIRVGEEPAYFRPKFVLTFWRDGAVPPWQGGTAQPVAAFSSLAADKDAAFTVKDLPPGLIPTGLYDLRVKGAGTLSVLVSQVAVDTSGAAPGGGPAIVRVDFDPLPWGDLTGDDGVDAADLEVLRSGFGQAEESRDFNPSADFNHDGVVDGQDFSLLAANFGRTGE